MTQGKQLGGGSATETVGTWIAPTPLEAHDAASDSVERARHDAGGAR